MPPRARWFASFPLAMLHAAASSPRAVPRWKQFKWVAPSVAAVTVLASWGDAWNRDRVIDYAFEIGCAPKPSTHAVIARDELIESLVTIVSSPSANNCYAFISGSLGTGKTTAVLSAIQQAPKGVIYVEIPAQPNRLRERLGAAINTDLGQDVHDPSSSMHAWDVFTRRFNEGAARFRERHGTIPVLVIDHVNILASTPGSPDEATLRVIQATAKSWADQGVAKVVLIASPGRTEQVLSEEKSDWSRVGELIEIGDVPESDAIAFLTSACHHKLSQGEIKFVYDQLTGGRTFLLGTVANSIQSGKNLEEICASFRDLAQGRFMSSSWYDASPEGDYFRSIVTALVKSPTHQLSAFDPIVNKHRHDFLPRLLLKRAIAVRRNKFITFESRKEEAHAIRLVQELR